MGEGYRADRSSLRGLGRPAQIRGRLRPRAGTGAGRYQLYGGKEGTPSMDSRRAAEVELSSEAADFVRFCYRRRRMGWPDLYDEMCAVAGRRLYEGWGFEDLAEHGIGFGLAHLPALAELVGRVIADEGERRAREQVRVVAASPTQSFDGRGSEVAGVAGNAAGPLLVGAPAGA